METREVITFRGFDTGSKTEFTNNSLNSPNSPKIGKLNIDTLIIPQGLSIHEKTQTKKSHATVPLSSYPPPLRPCSLVVNLFMDFYSITP